MVADGVIALILLWSTRVTIILLARKLYNAY